MGIWDDHARRIELSLGQALNRTDRWGRYMPEAGEDDEIAVPPGDRQLLPRLAPRTRRLAADMWPELEPETPAEAYRHDMTRRLREAERLGQELRFMPLVYREVGSDYSWMRPAPYRHDTPGSPMTLEYRPERDKPRSMTLEYRPERDKPRSTTLEYRPERDGPPGLYRNYPRMPRAPIRRGGQGCTR